MDNKIYQRTISAFIMLFSLLFLLVFLPPYLIKYAALLVLIVLLLEWMIFANFSKYIMPLILIFMIIFYLLFYNVWLSSLFIINLVLGSVFIYFFVTNKNIKLNCYIEVAYMFFASLCFGQALFFLWDTNVFLLLIALSLAFSADSAAFFIGSKLGNIKCFTAISPNKTLEGVSGGIVFSALLAFIYSIFFNNIFFLQGYKALFCGLFVGACCMFGDLIESAIKRKNEVKDSANWIPGHGGLLDRLDGMILALPGFWFMLKLLS